MENKIEIRQGGSYIFRQTLSRDCDPEKAKVLEITKKTIRVEWESGYKGRYMRDKFYRDYEVVEHIPHNHTSELSGTNLDWTSKVGTETRHGDSIKYVSAPMPWWLRNKFC